MFWDPNNIFKHTIYLKILIIFVGIVVFKQFLIAIYEAFQTFFYH